MVDILLVEDNQELSTLMCQFLIKDGYTVARAQSAKEAYKILDTETVKLAVLDVMLPDEDGFSICAKIREGNTMPILFLSALADKDSKMKSFLLGADDYVEKPVDIDILSVKIAAILKRTYDITPGAILQSGDLKVNQDRMEVTLKGVLIPLSAMEYDLLLVLIENPGKTLTKEFLFNSVWGANSESENQTLTVHIKMLRDKIEQNPKEPQRILTVWGVGYRYEKI